MRFFLLFLLCAACSKPAESSIALTPTTGAVLSPAKTPYEECVAQHGARSSGDCPCDCAESGALVCAPCQVYPVQPILPEQEDAKPGSSLTGNAKKAKTPYEECVAAHGGKAAWGDTCPCGCQKNGSITCAPCTNVNNSSSDLDLLGPKK